jgi:hypothetical protein
LEIAEIDGIFAFVVATSDVWKKEKGCAVTIFNVVNAVQTLVLVTSSH